MLRILPILLMTTILVTACGTPDTSPEHEMTEGAICLPELEEDPLEALQPSDYEKSDLFTDNILSGGVPPDGIPSIDDPVFITLEEAATLYNDNDPMFVTVLDGQTYLFPQSILVWHEIVNMSDHGSAVTYCPLTGSSITYKHPEDLETTFGTSGNLLNSNLVLYDRTTGTNISQIDGIGLDNRIEGYVLETVPTYWIDFGTAQASLEDALVLSEQTGYIRNYTSDPYGSYTTTERTANNYYRNEGTMFPVMNTTEERHDKEVVIGIKSGDTKAALIKSSVMENAFLNFTLEDQELSAVYDPQINNVRVFNGQLTLEDNILVDDTGNTWSVSGLSQSDAEDLMGPTHFEVMWFAWYAFYPDTEIIE